MKEARREGVHLFMKSSPTITLFTESRDDSQQPTSFVASLVLFHCMALGLLVFRRHVYAASRYPKAIAERYTVRNIDLETPEQQARREARRKVKYPGPRQAGCRPKPKPCAVASRHRRRLVCARLRKRKRARRRWSSRTLPTQLTLNQEVPVPTMVIWSPKKTDVKTVVAPQPEKATAANVKPMPDPPNRASGPVRHQHLGPAVAHAETANPAQHNFACGDSGARSSADGAGDRLTAQRAQPTPAAIMSLSDLKMAQGTVVLPPVNETAATDDAGSSAPGPAQDTFSAWNQQSIRQRGSGIRCSQWRRSRRPGLVPTQRRMAPDSSQPPTNRCRFRPERPADCHADHPAQGRTVWLRSW